jgi:hypothetical protein
VIRPVRPATGTKRPIGLVGAAVAVVVAALGVGPTGAGVPGPTTTSTTVPQDEGIADVQIVPPEAAPGETVMVTGRCIGAVPSTVTVQLWDFDIYRPIGSEPASTDPADFGRFEVSGEVVPPTGAELPGSFQVGLYEMVVMCHSIEAPHDGPTGYVSLPFAIPGVQLHPARWDAGEVFVGGACGTLTLPFIVTIDIHQGGEVVASAETGPILTSTGDFGSLFDTVVPVPDVHGSVEIEVTCRNADGDAVGTVSQTLETAPASADPEPAQPVADEPHFTG